MTFRPATIVIRIQNSHCGIFVKAPHSIGLNPNTVTRFTPAPLSGNVYKPNMDLIVTAHNDRFNAHTEQLHNYLSQNRSETSTMRIYQHEQMDEHMKWTIQALYQ